MITGFYRAWHIMLLLTLQYYVAGAQQQDTIRYRILNSEGTEFWLCFMKNYREQDPNNSGSREPAVLDVFITSEQDADVFMEIPALSFRHRLHINAHTIRSVRITPEAELDTSASAQLKALHITSTAPITVYALNRRTQTTDTYLALPLTVLGTEYRAICYSKLSAALAPLFAVIATSDDTQVSITPTTPTTDGHKAGETYTFTLDRGQVYQVRADFYALGSGDLTGTLIRATKPIAVFSGHTCAYVPSSVKACNHLAEQLPPINTWGKHYYIGKLKGRSRYTLRVLAAEDRTRVFQNQVLSAVLNAGEYYEITNATDHLQITADKPILVAQYSQGFANGDAIGDPMMILISPTQQFTNRYHIATPVQGMWDHYINIIAREDAIGTIMLDDRPIPQWQFERIGISSYFIAQIRLQYGSHTLGSNNPFGLYSYGFGYGDIDSYDAYGTMGGQTFFILDTLRDRLAPQSSFFPLKNGKTLHIVVRDDRPTDRGLASLTTLGARNLRAYFPRIEHGQPQAEFEVHPLDPEQDGSITLVATDLAGNRTVVSYTYCYNPLQQRFAFTPGDQCPQSKVWYVGLYGIGMALYHTASFEQIGSMQLQRPTSNAYGSTLSIGASITRTLGERLRISGWLSLEPYGRAIGAPDSLQTTVQFPLGDSTITVPVQTEITLKPSFPAVALGAAVEWTASTAQVGTRIYEWYFLAAARLGLQLSSNVHVDRRYVLPRLLDGTAVPGSARTQSVSTLRLIQPELVGGMGFIAPIPTIARIAAVLEVRYVYPLANILSQGQWTIERLQALLGARYSF